MSYLNIFIPSKITSVLNMFNSAGFEAYAVGGCVRDALLGKGPHDWDITTSAAPKEIQEVFKEYQQIDTGFKHGTVMVVIGKEVIEITTYRIDGEYTDGRRPDNVTFTKDITEDLARRDFTINACAISETSLVDPFGGQEDIRNKIIRCVGNPTQRFNEDALRILRGIRFASVLDFKVEENTRTAMLECRELLKYVSQERITTEFCKLLTGVNVHATLYEFKDILAYIIPEIKEMIGFEQHNPYHIHDVYGHSIKAVGSIESNIILRAAMFFHDIAKPACLSKDENGVGHFYGHPELSAQMTGNILSRMKFSNADIRSITELIEYHDAVIELSSKSIKKYLNKLGEVQFRNLLKVKRADILAQNPEFSLEGLGKLIIIEQILDEVLSQSTCFTLHDLAINGDDLILLGIPQGKQIGVILNKLLELVLNEELENDKKVLMGRLIYCCVLT